MFARRDRESGPKFIIEAPNQAVRWKRWVLIAGLGDITLKAKVVHNLNRIER